MKSLSMLPRARDLMNPHVSTVKPEATLKEVIRFLVQHELSNAPVVEPLPLGGNRLIGFISEGDCLEHLSNEMFFGNPTPPQTARTIMKRHPVCVSPDIDIFTLASLFVSHRFRHLPVVEGEKLVGIVSRRDILKSLEEFYGEEIRHHDWEKFPPDLRQIINHRFIVQND